MMRTLLLLAATLCLSGCQLRPLYAGGSSGPVAHVLRHVAVTPISGRGGWLVYNRLKEKLSQAGESETPSYRLDVELDDEIVGLAIRGDRAATRERRILRARYQLVQLSTGQVLLDATAGSDAGIDVVSSEYATVAAEQTAEERLAEIVASDIVERLGLYADQDRREAVKSDRWGFERLLDTPEPGTRFYLFHGYDPGQSRAHAERLLKGLSAEKVGVAASSAKSDPAILAAESAAIDMFGGRRAIWVEPAGDDISDAVEALLEASAAESPVIAVAGVLRKTSRLLKLAEGHRLALAHASYELNERDTDRLIEDLARGQGLRLSPGLAARVGGACGGERGVIAQELAKIALYLGASPERPAQVDADVLEVIGAGNEGEWIGIGDLALGGDVREVANELMRAPAGAEPITIVRALQRRLLMLARLRAKVDRGQSVGDAMASMGKALFFKDKDLVGKLLSQWSSAKLARVAERAGELELALMSKDSPPPVEALGEELIAVARTAGRRER